MCTLAFCILSPLRFEHEATPLHVMFVWLSLAVFCGSSSVCYKIELHGSIAMSLLCLLCALAFWRALGGSCWSSTCWPQTCVSVVGLLIVITPAL